MNSIQPKEVQKHSQITVEVPVVYQAGRATVEVLTKSEIKLLESNHSVIMLFVHNVILINWQNLKTKLLVIFSLLYIVEKHHFLNKFEILGVVLKPDNFKQSFIPLLI